MVVDMSRPIEARTTSTADDRPPVRLTPLTDGPYEITGPVSLVDADGQPLEPPADAVYLCRCGGSATKPFCDGSHARTGWTEEA